MNFKTLKYIIITILVACTVRNSSFAMMNENEISVQFYTKESIKSDPLDQFELERTFLAKEIPKQILGATPQIMVDMYIPEEGHAQLRVRQKGDEFEITKKTPVFSDNRLTKVMREISIPLTKEEFEAFQNLSKRKIYKHRYNVVIDGYPAEVDVFQGSLKGLVMIDFEFRNIKDIEKFKIPDVCLADVTHELFKAGGVLAGKSYSDIEEHLTKFQYKALDGDKL